jgi:hypothetical protein
MRGDKWSDKTRSEKLANILYPSLANEATRKEMTQLSANEGKKAPTATPLLPDHKRAHVSPLGGVANKVRR